MLGDDEIEALISEKIHALTGKKIASPHDELVDSGMLTSITMAELAVELEKAFFISLSFMEVCKENFASVATIKNLVMKKIR